jgi:hypothetical protein
MGTTAQRRAARERVAAYHEEQLGTLIARVAGVIDRYRAGEVDAFAVDETIHQYHRATQRLWAFCWAAGSGAHVEFVADTIDRLPEPIDWWQRGAPRRRDA